MILTRTRTDAVRDAGLHLYKIRVGGISQGLSGLGPASQHSCSASNPVGRGASSVQASGRRDLNPRHLSPEPSALPAALLPVQKKLSPSITGWALAGATGLEPAIFGLTGRRDNQLRYAPVMFNTISQTNFLVKHFFIKKQIFLHFFLLEIIC